jgi:hypothetical protein
VLLSSMRLARCCTSSRVIALSVAELSSMRLAHGCTSYRTQCCRVELNASRSLLHEFSHSHWVNSHTHTSLCVVLLQILPPFPNRVSTEQKNTAKDAKK